MEKDCFRSWGSMTYWGIKSYRVYVIRKQFDETYWKRISSYLTLWVVWGLKKSYLVFIIKINRRFLNWSYKNCEFNVWLTDRKLPFISFAFLESLEFLNSYQTFKEEGYYYFWSYLQRWIWIWSLDHWY